MKREVEDLILNIELEDKTTETICLKRSSHRSDEEISKILDEFFDDIEWIDYKPV